MKYSRYNWTAEVQLLSHSSFGDHGIQFEEFRKAPF